MNDDDAERLRESLEEMATRTSRQSFLIGLFYFFRRNCVRNARGGESKIRLKKRRQVQSEEGK